MHFLDSLGFGGTVNGNHWDRKIGWQIKRENSGLNILPVLVEGKLWKF